MIPARLRRLRFIQAFGTFALSDGVATALRRRGPDWLTDGQLEDIARDQADAYRAQQEMNRRNREHARSRVA